MEVDMSFSKIAAVLFLCVSPMAFGCLADTDADDVEEPVSTAEQELPHISHLYKQSCGSRQIQQRCLLGIKSRGCDSHNHPYIHCWP